MTLKPAAPLWRTVWHADELVVEHAATKRSVASRFNPNHDELGRFSESDSALTEPQRIAAAWDPASGKAPEDHFAGDSTLAAPAANAYGDTHYAPAANAYWSKLNLVTRAAVANMKGGSFRINRYLRFHESGEPPFTYVDPTQQAAYTAEQERLFTVDREGIPLIDAALASAPALEHDEIVYRGASTELLLQAGQTFTDKGYLSTTLSREFASGMARASAEGSALMAIKLPAGTRTLYMDDSVTTQSPYYFEAEFLLPRDSKLAIKGYDPDAHMWLAEYVR